MATETKGYTAVGTRPIRHDGFDKVTGKAAYGADVTLPGMLHAKLLRSPHAHANIKSIDTSQRRGRSRRSRRADLCRPSLSTRTRRSSARRADLRRTCSTSAARSSRAARRSSGATRSLP